jgi:uncharacterized membrane protein YkvA (DUF1232 family)
VVTEDGRIGPGTRDRNERTWLELATFLVDVARLLWAVARDQRVSWAAKAVAAGTVVYVVSPIDLVPDFIPGLGQLDDVFLIARALRFLANSAGYDILREHWQGSDDGFTLLLVLAGIRR